MAISSRVYIILDFLSEKEKVQIVPWLSIMHGEGKPYLAPLCQSLLDGLPSKKCWKAAFPDEPFHSGKFHRRCFTLADALDQFLVSQELLQSPIDSDRLLLRAYSARGSIELLDRAQAKMYKELYTNEEESRHNLSIEKLRLAHDVATARQVSLTSKGKMTVLQGIHELNTTFDTWWLHEKLYLTVITLYNNYSNTLPELPFLADRAIEQAKHILDPEESKTATGQTSLRFLYHLIVDILQKPDDFSRDKEWLPVLFAWLRKLGYQQQPLTYSITNFFYLLTGACINRNNRASDLELRNFYYRTIWELFLWGIERKILLRHGKLPWDTFISILATSYKLESYAREQGEGKGVYLDNLASLGRLLPIEDRSDALRIGEAMLFFYQKNYSKAQRILSIKFSKPMFEVLARSYLCQAMYQQYLLRTNADFEELRDISNALRRYLDRSHGLTESFQTRMKNFCVYFDKLCKDYRRDRLPGLVKRIQKTDMVAHREWLIARVKQKLESKEAKAKR